MEISWLQAILLGLFASLASMPGMGGSSIGNCTKSLTRRLAHDTIKFQFFLK